MIGLERFVEDLRALGWTVDGPLQSGGQQWAIVRGFFVPAGRYYGQLVDLAKAAAGERAEIKQARAFLGR